MRVQIVHRTEYRYSSTVRDSYNEVRLQPVSDAAQECHRFELITRPPARIKRYRDFHLNLVDHFFLSEAHDSLLIESRSEVTTFPISRARESVQFPMKQLKECEAMERCYDFLQGSEYITQEVEVWRQAKDITAEIGDAWEAAMAVMSWVNHEFTYDRAATTVRTRMIDALRSRRGVCQDFSHVFLGLCRSVGIPARYVSGYLCAGPADSMRGEQASHAWAEVFLPGHGWIGLDPTNGRLANEHHVKVAVGRDYADAAPLRGSFRGQASQEMTVELKIERSA